VKEFLADLNLARAIILLSIVGSVALAWIGWQRSSDLADMRARLDRDVPKLVTEIQQLSKQHTQLYREREGEGLKGQTDPETYIVNVAAADKVEVGQLKLTPLESSSQARNVVDKKYRIQPSNRDRTFQRSRVANFLYMLERESRRIKVTQAKFEIADPNRTKAEDVPKDEWKFEAEVTSRQKVEPASKP
jgi:hypothetical protein